MISKLEEEQEEDKDVLLSVVSSFLRKQQEGQEATGDKVDGTLLVDE
jgi:dihydroxyacetone kinase